MSAREGRVVLALGRRAFTVQFRRAQLLMPTLVLPLVLLAVIASGTAAGQELRGFPDVSSYLAFLVPGTIVQGMTLAGLSAGIAMASDIEFGFFDRLLAAPVHRTSLVLGRLCGIVGLAVLQVSLFLTVAALFGARYPGGVVGVFGAYVIAVLTAVGIGGIGVGDRAPDRLAVAAAEPVPVRLRVPVHRAGLLPAGAAVAGAARRVGVQPDHLRGRGRAVVAHRRRGVRQPVARRRGRVRASPSARPRSRRSR